MNSRGKRPRSNPPSRVTEEAPAVNENGSTKVNNKKRHQKQNLQTSGGQSIGSRVAQGSMVINSGGNIIIYHHHHHHDHQQHSHRHGGELPSGRAEVCELSSRAPLPPVNLLRYFHDFLLGSVPATWEKLQFSHSMLLESVCPSH